MSRQHGKTPSGHSVLSKKPIMGSGWFKYKKKTKARQRKYQSLKRRKPEETGSRYHPAPHMHCEGKQNELCLCWAVRTRGRGKQWAKPLGGVDLSDSWKISAALVACVGAVEVVHLPQQNQSNLSPLVARRRLLLLCLGRRALQKISMAGAQCSSSISYVCGERTVWRG